MVKTIMTATAVGFLHIKRMALAVTAQGQMDVLALPLERETRTKVSMAHASTEAEILAIDAEIRRIKRGTGLVVA